MAALAPAGALAAGLRGVRLRPVPDQRERAAVLVLDEVREDRRREEEVDQAGPGGIRDRSPWPSWPRPRRARPRQREAIGGSAFLVAFDRMRARPSALEVEGLDLALERAVAVEGEGADGGLVESPVLSLKATRAALMAIDRPGGDEPAPKGSKRRGERRAAAICSRGMARSGRGK